MTNPDFLRDIGQAAELALAVVTLFGVGTFITVTVRVILFFKNLELLMVNLEVILQKVLEDQQTMIKEFKRVQSLTYKESVT